MNLASKKKQLIIFLGAFALYLSIINKELMFLFTTAIAVISCVISESALVYLKTKQRIITESSIISGLIIGFVLSFDEPWWIFVLASVLAISSKHLIRLNKKHLFNPAGFGVFLAIILFGAQTQWQGTYLWYILTPIGLYFTFKIKKIEVLAGYFLATIVLFGSQAIIQKSGILNLFGFLGYFYIFVMVIEPKTSPFKPLGKFIFGASLGSLIFILTQSGVKFDAELFSLLVLNLSVPLLNKYTGGLR